MSERDIKRIFDFGAHEMELLRNNALRNNQSIKEFIRNSILCNLYDYSMMEIDLYDGKSL